ncbi:amino acid permease [Christensenella tenuis]|jgi:glutamate:GABA antiporter|uniref:Amino acid permease n=1 Tax=Christensenella tenuis TaxID=2763033 RepID=A0ABR7EI64_9FIRM|nr:amino acid permease [Christensenella tenuis]MBC5649443.1 amino acid permease [Christensenella tenuis]
MKKISFMQLIFLTMAYFASVRRIPNIAYAGWESISFMIFAVLMFVIPISFVAAELATAMPEDGGLSVWIGRALSPRFFPHASGSSLHGSYGSRCVLAW